MCTALAIAGLALSVGGTAMNSMAASKAARARDDALAAERIRQQGYDQEAAALNTRSQDRYQDFSGQQDQKAQDLGDYFGQQHVVEPEAAAAMPTSQSAITVAEEGKQRDAATDYTTKQGQALGALRSFGDLLGQIGRSQARDAGYIGQIGGFKRGSSNVLPLELDQASRAGDGLETFGRVLSNAGKAAGLAGAWGASLGDLFGGSAPVVNSAAKSSMLTAGGKMGGSGGYLNLGNLYGPAAKSQDRFSM